MPADERVATPRGAIGLLLTPVVIGIAAITLPHVHLAEEVASLVVFGGAGATTLTSLSIAAGAYPPWRWRWATAALATLALAGLALGRVAWPSSPVLVDTALVAAAWAIGTSLGRRIEHPGHLLPACVVVACADLSSVVSQWGPTHAIAENDAALSIVSITFPVPGTTGFAPALGVGDLVFIAIVFGAVMAHGLSLARATLSCGLGIAAAGAASAALETAIPALVPIAAAVVLGLPDARRVRPHERRAATVAIVIAMSVAAAAIAAQLLGQLSGAT
jgi:hypothetical protein